MTQSETQTVITGLLAGIVIVGTFAQLLLHGSIPSDLSVIDGTVISFYFGTLVRSSNSNNSNNQGGQ